MKQLGIMLVMMMGVVMITGCSGQMEEVEQEIVWDTLPPAEQGIEVTVSDIAREQMEVDWEQKSSSTSLFMLIPGSS